MKNEKAVRAALRGCTAGRSPRKGRAWLSPLLKKVIHDSRERVAFASDGAILAAVPSLYDPAMGAVTPPGDVPDWKAVVPQCAGTAWRVDAPALAREIARVLKCAKAIWARCFVTVRFGEREMSLDAEYLKRAFRLADAYGERLELRTDETGTGPAFMRGAAFTLAVMPLRGDAERDLEAVWLDGDALKVVRIPKPVEPVSRRREELRRETEEVARDLGVAGRNNDRRLPKRLKSLARKALAVDAEEKAWNELERMIKGGCAR